MLDEEFSMVFDKINQDEDRESLADQALRLAISSYAEKIACQEILKKLGE